ncbi:MAG TPA: DUF1080 domain-containing protein [Capsulimonadaceae bacterium]|jgi:hypothetical protein
MIINTLGNKAPDGAATLFDGTSLDAWTNMDGAPAGWTIDDGAMKVTPGNGDVKTERLFGDHYLHLEFRLSSMPDKTGQAKSNSGVFIQGRYEIQVLDSSGWATPGFADCGAIYDQLAPLTNACKPGMEWQTYDVIFRAPRCEGKVVREQARLTVIHNGIIIHNNVQVAGTTGAPSDLNVQLPGHLRLQDHGDTVWYRNIWAIDLPKEGANTYGPK